MPLAGAGVGRALGAAVGAAVLLAGGAAAGAGVGRALGAAVGAAVGPAVLVAGGALAGAGVGGTLGAAVGGRGHVVVVERHELLLRDRHLVVTAGFTHHRTSAQSATDRISITGRASVAAVPIPSSG